jgi:hypothetical protein
MGPRELVVESLRSPTGESNGEWLPAILTGVGKLEFDIPEEVRSCCGPCSVCMGDVSSGWQFPILYEVLIKSEKDVSRLSAGA